MTKQDTMLHEREYYVAKVFLSLGMQKQLNERWAFIGYTPKPIQLELNL